LSSVPSVRRRLLSPERLDLARRFRGLTQQALADELQVSASAVSQFEAGATAPAPETLERLTMVLKVSPAFLARPLRVRHESEPFFRALRRTPAVERDRASAYALLLSEIGEMLDEYVEMPPVRVEQLITADHETSEDVIEAVAAKARTNWGVPAGPIADVVNLAEAGGVLVAAVGNFDPGMDAFSIRTSKRPVVVLCTSKGIAARRRFDMAHELGHLVLHANRLPDPRRQEEQAHRFASALLMPAEEIEPFLPRHPGDLAALEDTAKTWGVSMQAALFRAKHLKVLSPDDYTRAMRRLSAAGWRTREPIEIGPPERPRLLSRAVATLPAAGTSLGQLAESFGMPVGRLARMLSLPEDHDDARENVVDLQRARIAIA
jgi:Zn-dependent peptidase ImmA (M78 family)/transcriptional regulator with XRE-family HTH domain